MLRASQFCNIPSRNQCIKIIDNAFSAESMLALFKNKEFPNFSQLIAYFTELFTFHIIVLNQEFMSEVKLYISSLCNWLIINLHKTSIFEIAESRGCSLDGFLLDGLYCMCSSWFTAYIAKLCAHKNMFV